MITPERLAELRCSADYGDDCDRQEELSECLDEIKRLREVLRYLGTESYRIGLVHGTEHPMGAFEVWALDEIKRLRAYPGAVDKIRSYYPTDVFPEDGDSKDCVGARFARSLCDQIHEEAAEASAEREEMSND